MFLLHFINNPKFLFQYPGGKEGFAAYLEVPHIQAYLFIYLFIWLSRRFVRNYVQTFGMNILPSFSDSSCGHSQTVSRHIPRHPAHKIWFYSHPDHFEPKVVENMFQGNVVAHLHHYTTVIQTTAVETSSLNR